MAIATAEASQLNQTMYVLIGHGVGRIPSLSDLLVLGEGVQGAPDAQSSLVRHV